MIVSSSIQRPVRSGSGQRQAQRGGTLLGVVIGFALGVAIAGLIAFALTKSSNPFDGKTGRITDPSVAHVGGEPKSGEPRFDFSKILPGVESRRSHESSSGEKTGVVAPGTSVTPGTGVAAGGTGGPSSGGATARSGAGAGATSSTPEKAGKFFLQAGAYQNVADAEDQRAKLALMGIEASLQAVSLPDKGTLSRVRLGPFDTAEEMNSVKTELSKRGVATAVIKAQ